MNLSYEDGFGAGAEAMRLKIVDAIRNEPELPGFPPLGVLFKCILKGPIGNARHWIRVAKAVTVKRIQQLSVPTPQTKG